MKKLFLEIPEGMNFYPFHVEGDNSSKRKISKSLYKSNELECYATAFVIVKNKVCFLKYVKPLNSILEKCAKGIKVKDIVWGEKFLAKAGDPFEIELTPIKIVKTKNRREWVQFKVSDECIIYFLIQYGRKIYWVEKIK